MFAIFLDRAHCYLPRIVGIDRGSFYVFLLNHYDCNVLIASTYLTKKKELLNNFSNKKLAARVDYGANNQTLILL